MSEILNTIDYFFAYYVSWWVIFVCFITTLFALYYTIFFEAHLNLVKEANLSKQIAIAYSIICVVLSIIKIFIY